MKTICLNGFLYSIKKWLPDFVVEEYRHNWTERNAIELARKLNAGRELVRLIGFSDGATAALTVANHCDYVREVYCHSCQYREHRIKREFETRFFATIGDRAGTILDGESIYDQTLATFEQYAQHDRRRNSIEFLEWVPFKRPTMFEGMVLRPLGHQFHNCVDKINYGEQVEAK
jgi:hypothetical protein